MLLTSSRRAVIAATTPAIAANITKITPVFYQTMFKNNPEVLQFFNLSNQRNAAQPQALADAVVAAVGKLDDLASISSTLAPAVHKHCALGVLPEHYKIVHDNFLTATAKVLGPAVTPEVADAWSAVLLHLAGNFIALEKDLYARTTAKLDRWDSKEPKEFIVKAKTIVAENFVALELERTDGGRAPVYEPGQFLTLCANPTTSKHFAPRHYTLAAPVASKDNSVRICVKNVDGVMSSFVHSSLNVGSTVMVRPPFGDFTTAQADGFEKIAFITAGAGITPALAMLEPLIASGKKVAHFHVEPTEAHVPFRNEIGKLKLASSTFHIDGGRKDVTPLAVANATGFDLKDPKTATMLCAPPSMIHEFHRTLLQMGVSERNIKWENFGPRHG